LEDEMGGACSMHRRELRTEFSVEKPEGKRRYERYTGKMMIILKRIVKKEA
jgi:hypothetical protein